MMSKCEDNYIMETVLREKKRALCPLDIGAVRLMLLKARADERAKVAEEIFKWLDNQPYFQTGDGEYEDFVREYAELKERFLGKQKPEGEKR
jgi:hypothetical protein